MTEILEFAIQNQIAVDRFMASRTGKDKTLPALVEASPYGSINYLRLLGLVCVGCGGSVTLPNFRFYKYDPESVLCYECRDNY